MTAWGGGADRANGDRANGWTEVLIFYVRTSCPFKHCSVSTICLCVLVSGGPRRAVNGDSRHLHQEHNKSNSIVTINNKYFLCSLPTDFAAVSIALLISRLTSPPAVKPGKLRTVAGPSPTRWSPNNGDLLDPLGRGKDRPSPSSSPLSLFLLLLSKRPRLLIRNGSETTLECNI